MTEINWHNLGDYADILYQKTEGIAKITINRPEVRNAFRPQTVSEMSDALEDAREDQSIGVVILTGQGDKAFCSGGDQKVRGDSGYKDHKGVHRLNVRLDGGRWVVPLGARLERTEFGDAVGIVRVIADCRMQIADCRLE